MLVQDDLSGVAGGKRGIPAVSIIVPSPEQQAILDLGLTSVKVRAGAGTGKTTTVAMVIANLISRHGVEPEQVLGITFTNKAASELSDRVRSTIGVIDPGHQAEVHTYHGFAAQVLSEFGALAGVDTRAKVITPTFSRQLLSEIFYSRGFEHLDQTQTRTLDRIRRLGDRIGDHLLTADDLLAIEGDDPVSAGRREMATVLVGYDGEKRRLGVVDFADLVTLSTGIVSEHPELARVIRDRYRVVVLDEYQDTNPAQRTLLMEIFGGGFPVIAVGDEDQTIYEWRGASAENFEQFGNHFPSPEGKPAHLRGLTLNRRSTQKILDVANQVRLQANPEGDPLTSALPDDQVSKVTTHWANDAAEEAEWIANTFERLNDGGLPWKEMAVLLRKNKDFAIIVETLSRHDIPIEVANVGGLLSVPEVADLRAWLTVLENPGDSVALTQILLGSRYRLGFADLEPLVRRAIAGHEPDLGKDEPTPVTLIEAIEETGDIVDLRPEARATLADFHTVYRRALLESQGLTLVEVCRLILDLTGAWRDIEALPRSQRLTARLNLYRLLDLAEDWSPLRGRPSLQAFLEYLATTEEEASDELDSARLSGEDAVSMVTIHRAKGLEWDTVALPAVTAGNFPSTSQMFANPLKFSEHLPAELRIDGVLDGIPSDVDAYTSHLRASHNQQEWRVAYVGVTRAKRRLYMSGAYWYGSPEPSKTAKKPSELWELVNRHSGSVPTLPQPSQRPELIRLGDERGAPDPLFPEGWEESARTALADPKSVTATVERLGIEAEHRDLVSTLSDRLFALAEPEEGAPETEPGVVSVTGLVTYAQCPKRFYWTDIDPLPRRANPAATRGTEVHRRIELHQRGKVPLDLVDIDLYDVPDAEAGPRAFDTYLSSRFAGVRATLVEAPFFFDTQSGYKVRGRIDAIYEDGPRWEVVDFKSGRPGEDPARIVQLQAYAVAVNDVDFGLPRPEGVTVTFAYLGGGGSEVSYAADAPWLSAARSSVEDLTGRIGDRVFDERPGEWCRRCDFLRFCEPGRRWIAE